MKKLPIGVSNFEGMIKGNYYYVDKTLLINDIIDLSGMEWIEERTSAEMFRMLDELDRMLNKGEYKGFAEHLRSFIESGLSYYDVAKSESERFYKGFLLGILAIAVNGYKVESELESGYGNSTLLFIRKIGVLEATQQYSR